MHRIARLSQRLFTPAVLSVTVLCVPLVADAVGPARWTPSVDWGGGNPNRYAVNMILMAGDGAPYHSRVLWYRGHGSSMSGLGGGEWGWLPGSESCENYPSGSFVALNPPDPQMDLFCSGHVGLADGRVLIVGGNDPESEHYGDKQTRIFTPGTGTSAGGWSNPPDLAERRWYPTAVTLRDGRVATFAGSHFRQHYVFGGRLGGAPPASPQGDLVRQHGPYGDEAWDPAVLPQPDAQYGRPDAREAHTGVYMAAATNYTGGLYFGGARGDGQLLNDAWLLKRTSNVLGADYGYQWTKLVSPILDGAPPSPRREHTAVLDAEHGQMIVFGGLAGNNQPVNDVWRLYWNSLLGKFVWAPVQPAGEAQAPTARHGHTAFFESRDLYLGPNGKQKVHRMIVRTPRDRLGRRDRRGRARPRGRLPVPHDRRGVPGTEDARPQAVRRAARRTTRRPGSLSRRPGLVAPPRRPVEREPVALPITSRPRTTPTAGR